MAVMWGWVGTKRSAGAERAPGYRVHQYVNLEILCRRVADELYGLRLESLYSRAVDESHSFIAVLNGEIKRTAHCVPVGYLI